MKSAQGPSPNQDPHKPGQMCGSQNKSLFMYFFKQKYQYFLREKNSLFLKVIFT